MKKLMKPAKQLGLSEALCGRPEGEPVALVWPTLGTMWGRPVAKATKDSGGSGERGHWSFEEGGGRALRFHWSSLPALPVLTLHLPQSFCWTLPSASFHGGTSADMILSSLLLFCVEDLEHLFGNLPNLVCCFS